MKTYRCKDHGFEMTVSGDRGEHRAIRTPPPVSVRSRAGISGDCALPVCPSARLQAGEVHRFHPTDGTPLAGTCHIEEV